MAESRKKISFPSGETNLRNILTIAVWLVLTICFYQPARQILDGESDPSIFTAYAYYLAHGFQFGPDALAMGGPYAFIMYGVYYGGDLFWLRVVGELALQGIFSALLLWFFFRQSSKAWLKWLWLPAQLMFSAELADLTVAWTMLLAGFLLLEKSPDKTGNAWSFLAAALLGWLALFKGTHLVLSFATIGVVTTTWVLMSKWRHALSLGACYLISLLTWWMVAQQNPLNFLSYVKGTLHLAAAYNEAMSLDEPANLFWRGAVVTTGLIFLFSTTAWIRKRNPTQLAGLLLMAGYTFVMWKHGFVRADSHMVIFFCFVCVAIPAWYLHFIIHDGLSSRNLRFSAGIASAVLLGVSLVGPVDPARPPLGVLFRYLKSRIEDHTRYLAHLPAERRALEARLNSQRDLNALPNVQAIAGRSTIDCFGPQQGIIPLNNLNYRPRPMGAGTFAVCDSYLMTLNRDFVRDPARRPDFFLLRLDTIDNRFITQDDGLALQELIHGYEPKLIEQNFLLLRARPGSKAPSPKLLYQQKFKFGEIIKVPALKENELLLTRFVFSQNTIGKLRATLYKSPQLSITLRDAKGGELGIRRLVPSMSISPFIFSPWIENTADLLGIYDTTRGVEPNDFVVSCQMPQYYADTLTVEFSILSRPTPMDSTSLAELRGRQRFPSANIVPESITPAFKEHNAVRYVHAPSEIVWSLTGQERELNFQYGMDPQTYQSGSTNGVEFIAEVRSPSGGVTRTFSRLLQPLDHPKDQGKQSASITLPIYAPGSRLALRTDPGPDGNNAWDWSYVSHIEIKKSRFTAEQFPGFNRIPHRATGENAAVIEVDGKKMLLLHIPNDIQFDLTGEEKYLILNFGFLPGAYSNGGRTPGGDYILELVHADGTSREIFRRSLRPLDTPEDRGRQSAKISLQADITAGDILTLRTAAPPNANNSWGWTYVESLSFE